MRMDDMTTYLENRGFDVERTYIKEDREYDFAICLSGRPIMHARFKYPETADRHVADRMQKDFLDKLAHSYTRTFGCLGQAPETEFIKYAREDVITTMTAYNKMYANNVSLTIKNVIFNDPATIVFWMDGTKTVVKCQEGDMYDPEKGLAMAISKKALGNQGNYYKQIDKWMKTYRPVSFITPKLEAAFSKLMDDIRRGLERR